MVEIQLSQNKRTIISAEDEERVRQHRWYARKYTKRPNLWYAVANINGKKVSLHRFLLNARPGEIVDHRDQNGLNNTRENIRITTYGLNNQNSMRNTGAAGVKGVYQDPKTGRWIARMQVDYRQIRVGTFKTKEDAASAYLAATREWYG